MSIRAIGVSGLVLVFLVGTLRPINLGTLALVMTFLVGTIVMGESAKDMYSGFPVDLFLLLTGVTYLYAIASSNGTVERSVQAAARLVKDRRALIPWLLVCGVVTYVAALQRYGTVDAVGHRIAGLSTPLVTALLICVVGAVTSAFASSAGILGAMIPLAVPLMVQGTIGTTGLVVALAISATVVDSTPFSTVGALVVANAGTLRMRNGRTSTGVCCSGARSWWSRRRF